MALKITIVICLTIIIVLSIILLILFAGQKVLDAQNKADAEEVERLEAKLRKAEVHAEAMEMEAYRLRKENLELRREHKDFGILGEVLK